MTTYRCEACGNKTRFDVVEAKRVRSFLHFTLGGEATVESEEVLELTIEKVVCRWCGASLPVSASAGVPAAPTPAEASSASHRPSPPPMDVDEPHHGGTPVGGISGEASSAGSVRPTAPPEGP